MTDVFLYIYDLSLGLAKKLGPILLDTHIEGIWHTAIGLYILFSESRNIAYIYHISVFHVSHFSLIVSH
jgi:hypothetical protein